jgi:2-iminobutanoate/2-iminopropanoate deaminase
MKEVISAADAPASAGPYSPGLIVGDLIFLSGQGGFDPETGELASDDIAGQTAQVFRNIETLLHSAGAGLDDVVSCLVHLRDLALFGEFNASYERHFPGPAKPVRTTVRADLVNGMLVEVTVIAGLPHR